ncbi:MAG: PadR family transcriptional regulator [Bacillota bacterium]|nr:PadR family transcriptional regulator [Bacillota bacterium]
MSLKHGILGLLNYSPITGYNLKKLFDKSINNVWTASLSQIYRELGTLEKEGYVTSHIEEQEDRPDRKVYQISDEGKRVFMEWLTESPDTFVSPKRDEFMLRLFFAANLQKSEVKRYLEQFIDNREKTMKSFDEDQKKMQKLVKAAFDNKTELKEEDELYMRFIIKRAQMTNQLLIKWARECIEELEN